MIIGLCSKHKNTAPEKIISLISGEIPIYESPYVKSTIDLIEDVVCNHFNVKKSDLREKSRGGNIPNAKHWVCFLIHFYNIGLTHEQIADIYNIKRSNVTFYMRDYRVYLKTNGNRNVLKYFTELIDQKITINK